MARILCSVKQYGIMSNIYMARKAINNSKHFSTVVHRIHSGQQFGLEYTVIEHNLEKRGVVYIPGFSSGKDSDECIILKEYFKNNSTSNFLCYDPHGIGMSELPFSECNLSSWIEDAKRMIDMMHEITSKPPLVIGKSLGGHVASCIAQRQICDIHSLVLICPAINFAHLFHEVILSVIPKQQLQQLEERKVIMVDVGPHENWEPFPYSLKLYEDFAANSILESMCPIEGNFPVRILHGLNDQTVPFERSIKLDKMFKTDDLQLNLIKNCDHIVMNNKYGLGIVLKTIEMLLES